MLHLAYVINLGAGYAFNWCFVVIEKILSPLKKINYYKRLLRSSQPLLNFGCFLVIILVFYERIL